jgi:hypothetical protein
MLVILQLVKVDLIFYVVYQHYVYRTSSQVVSILASY